MEVDVENVSDKREYIDADEINLKVKKLLYTLRGYIEQTSDIINDELIPTAKEWAGLVKDVFTMKCEEIKCEFLTKDEFIKIIKDNKVENCDSNIAYKKMKDDGTFQIIIAYIKNGKILPLDENVNLIIQCEGMSRELKEMFGEKDIIIIK